MIIRYNQSEINPRQEAVSIFKTLLILLAVLSIFNTVQGQTKINKNDIKSNNLKSLDEEKKSPVSKDSEKSALSFEENENASDETDFDDEIESPTQKFTFFNQAEKFERIKKAKITRNDFLKPVSFFDEKTELDEENFDEKSENVEWTPDDDSKAENDRDKFHWKSAMIQSGIFLGIQHGSRLIQKKTRRELKGPFFRDWLTSIKNLRGWNDGDSILINYVAHTLQGGVTGRIFINNSDKAKRQVFGSSKEYWESRFKTFVWSAAWSVQFEFGPISESNIGNVGLREKFGYSSMGWVDLVVTPAVGTGLVIGEDMIDKYILKNVFEKNTGRRISTKIKILRTFLTPTTSFSNILRGKYPWKRDNRF